MTIHFTADEAQRQILLSELQVLDTAPEAGFDGLTQAARIATGWPFAFISLVDARRLWFKSAEGWAAGETPRQHAFCAHALLSDQLFEVSDALADGRFAQNSWVVGMPRVRAYAGQPLTVLGVRLGTLCLMHTVPSRLTESERLQVRALAASASALLAERLNRTRLAKERARLADFGLASGDWLWESDEQHRIVWLSAGFELVMNRSATTQLGKAFPDVLLSDSRGQPLQPAITLLQLLGRGKAFTRATVNFGLDDGPRWVSLSAVPLTRASIQERGMRGTARDVTAQVLSERAHDNEAQRLRRLVAMAPGALYQFRVDSSGAASFPFATQGLEALFEVSPAQAAQDANPVFERIHPQDLPAIQRSIGASLTALAPWQATFRVRLPKGGERHLSAHSTPQRNADGSVLWHGLVTDVTTQVLERQDRERLQRERDRAQRDARARADALSRVSHELRTPLNAILGFTQLMQGSLDRGGIVLSAQNDPWPRWVAHVHRASSHLLALVNDVLDLSSLEARRYSVELQPVDLGEMVEQLVDLMRSQAALRDQQLEQIDPLEGHDQVESGRLFVMADKRALRQVLINLIGNACRYTPQGGRIVLRWRRSERNDMARVEVCDNGPGISAEDQARLFRPFQRGSDAERSTMGTGLGLAISHQLVTAMNGKFSVASRLGEGAVFAVELPLAKAETGKASQSPRNDSLFGGLDPISDREVADLPSRLLLYVEDDPVNGLLMQEFVARTPALRLHVAQNLAEGRAAIRSLKPDLVLLDMNLPDGSGYDLLSEIRADSSTANLRVVALSADAMLDQARQAKEKGFDDYWTKPVDFKLLRRRLGTLLK